TVCTHRVSTLKGQKIIHTDHKRDKSAATAEKMECLSDMMPDRDVAMAWLERVRDSKSSYSREQVQTLTQTESALEPVVAARTLEYCMANGIDGVAELGHSSNPVIIGGDFNAVPGTDPINIIEGIFQSTCVGR